MGPGEGQQSPPAKSLLASLNPTIQLSPAQVLSIFLGAEPGSISACLRPKQDPDGRAKAITNVLIAMEESGYPAKEECEQQSSKNGKKPRREAARAGSSNHTHANRHTQPRAG